MVFQKKSAIIRKEKLIANNIKRGIESKARYAEEKARWEAAEQAEAAAQMSPTKSAACCGRRVVKLQFLADSLWCDFCGDSLCLKFVENEERKGLASDFTIRCHRCLLVYRVHSDEKGGLRLKAALGCMDSGVGHEQFNKLLSVMNLPPLYRNTFIRAQECVGQSLASVARNSCKEAIQLEKGVTEDSTRARRTLSESNVDNIPMETSPCSENPEDPPIPNIPDSTPRRARRVTICETVSIAAKGDMGWDKRGNGRSYNSHSGRMSVMAALSNKILAYDVVSNYCAKCARGATPGDHKCAKNYDGCAKGMEPHSASKLIASNVDLQEAGVVIGQFIGDRDSSTIARLRRDCSHPVEKIIDLNHTMSGFNNALYKNCPKYKWLKSNIIDYLKRALGYAIKQHKGDAEGVRAAIMIIEKHTFGEHEECGDWCGAKEDPANYIFKSLPRQTGFTEEKYPGWRSDFHAVLLSQAREAENLAPCGSTQQNESFNHMAVTRARKSRFYTGTEANFLRVSAAVCEKNLGSAYTEQVFGNSALSPPAFRTRLNVERGKRSGMASVMERASEAASGPSWLPELIHVTDACVPVIIDLETTGFLATDQIVQIAVKCGTEQQSWYMVPTKKIHPGAAAVTGLNMRNGKLYLHDCCKDTTTPTEVARQLLQFLASCGSSVFLTGRNIIQFDAPRIIKFMKEQGFLKEFGKCVAGFTDTLPLLKQGTVKKQAELAKKYLTGTAWEDLQQSAHNALTDCIVLEGLLNHFEVSNDLLWKSLMTFRAFMERQVALKKINEILPSLQPLSTYVTKHMIGKMAFAGVTIDELEEVYEEKQLNGLVACLGVQINGKPR
ncbi:Ribonuclease T, partial [Frankliniella fusca]